MAEASSGRASPTIPTRLLWRDLNATDGVPSVRMVLAKRIDEPPLPRNRFFTNAGSKKGGRELAREIPEQLCAFTGRFCGDRYRWKEKYRSLM